MITGTLFLQGHKARKFASDSFDQIKAIVQKWLKEPNMICCVSDVECNDKAAESELRSLIATLVVVDQLF